MSQIADDAASFRERQREANDIEWLEGAELSAQQRANRQEDAFGPIDDPVGEVLKYFRALVIVFVVDAVVLGVAFGLWKFWHQA